MTTTAAPLPYEPPQLTYTYLGRYLHTADFTVTVDGRTFTVPAGTITDLATSPRLFWQFIPPIGLYESAAALHDWLCTEGIRLGLVTSREADRYFRLMMRDGGVGFCTRWLMWCAVRLAAPFTARRRPSELWRDLPVVAPVALAVLVLVYYLAVGADRLAHLLRFL